VLLRSHTPWKNPSPVSQMQAYMTYLLSRGAGDGRVFRSVEIGDNVELKYDLVRFLLELEIPTSTISAMTGLSGRELREIFASDPISLFPCLETAASSSSRATAGTMDG